MSKHHQQAGFLASPCPADLQYQRMNAAAHRFVCSSEQRRLAHLWQGSALSTGVCPCQSIRR